MENLLHDIVNHNLQNRTVAFMENGSWAPAAGGLMRQLMMPLKGMKYINETVTIRSSLKQRQASEMDALANAIAATIPGSKAAAAANKPDMRSILRTSPAEMLKRRCSSRCNRSCFHVQVLLRSVRSDR